MKPTYPAKPTPHHSPARVVSSRPPTAEERRRAQRVLLRMNVTVHIAGRTEPIHAVTHTVSESGAMIIMREPLAEGTKVMVEIAKTQKTVEAKVVRPPQPSSEGMLVPVQFMSASPNFWGVFFPPSASN